MPRQILDLAGSSPMSANTLKSAIHKMSFLKISFSIRSLESLLFLLPRTARSLSMSCHVVYHSACRQVTEPLTAAKLMRTNLEMPPDTSSRTLIRRIISMVSLERALQLLASVRNGKIQRAHKTNHCIFIYSSSSLWLSSSPPPLNPLQKQKSVSWRRYLSSRLV
ncbi:hypothetical protein SCHPADRAFT_901525, partial [Schizopora paradoxa]